MNVSQRAFVNRGGAAVRLIRMAWRLAKRRARAAVRLAWRHSSDGARGRNEHIKNELCCAAIHELRTPLTSIAGSLQLLLAGAGGELPSAATRLLSIAESNCQRLVRLINDILDVEKIESGTLPLQLAQVELRSLVRHAIEANRGFADQYGVRISLARDADSFLVEADEDRLIQVITNLLSNAIRFSPAGEEVTVGIERGDAVRIWVRDRGPGIPADFAGRIFEKFTQAEVVDGRHKGGSGLGLYIVRQIVSQHGGTVGFEPAAGGGAIFFVDLPAMAAPSQGAPFREQGAAPLSPADSEARAAAMGGARRPRILHVDDDGDLLQVVADSLHEDAAVVSVNSMAAARRAIEEEDFGLVILDLSLWHAFTGDLMPDLRRRDGRRIPVVVFSGSEANPTLAARVDACLTKSRDSIDQLVATVRGLLADGASLGQAPPEREVA